MLFILGASQTQGYRRTSLHPLGSLDDHAYVINDAEITTLIVDPVFVERAVGLLDKCPGLKQVLTIGPVPEALAHVGKDLVADGRRVRAAAARGGRCCRRDHMTSITYTGGTTGNPKGVIGLTQSFSHDDPDPARRVGVAGEPAVPHVHAAVARRRGVLRARR